MINESNKYWEKEHITSKLTSLATDKEWFISSNHGYVVAPQKINRCIGLTDLEIRLFNELSSNMGYSNYAYPGHKYLAFKLGKKSVTSIKNALKSLQEKGFIYWEIGGGDLGTNHYYLKNLYYNPYIIMSEATYHCIDKINELYRRKINYDALYRAVKEFTLTDKNNEGKSSVYRGYIDHLFNYPEDRDLPNLYSTYCDNLVDYIEETIGFTINIIWETHFQGVFEKRFSGKDEEDDGMGLLAFLKSQGLLERSRVIEEKFGYKCTESYSDEIEEYIEVDLDTIHFIIDRAKEIYSDYDWKLKGSYFTKAILNQLT